MDFGKLLHIDDVDWSLPPDDERNADVLQASRENPETTVRIGAPGWGEPRWNGRVYPPSTVAKDFLRHYSRQFRTIELNSTFYGIPSASVVDGWRDKVPENFRFCPKVFRDASHDDSPVVALRALRNFADVIGRLGPRMGGCFLQLPPELGPLQRVRLVDLLAAWPATIPIAVEFRHPDWFSHCTLIDAARRTLIDAGAGVVITDVAGRRDVCHSTLTTDLVMIRCVGNNLHPTDRLRATWWAQRIRQWADQGAIAAYVFAHQPDNVKSPEFSTMLSQALQQHAGMSAPTWKPVPTQASLF